jgi:hypothetical protein
MALLTQIVIILNALVHLGFAVGEIFITTYLLEKLFGFSHEDAIKTHIPQVDSRKEIIHLYYFFAL